LTETVASILWHRLNGPGHDACLLEQVPDGWRIDGTAVFRENGVLARFSYQVTCDAGWRTQAGQVAGFHGPKPVLFQIVRGAAGAWQMNGQPVPNLEDCVDLDLGFTPATNLLQLRRVALREGESADVPVAWLDVSAGRLERLAQQYSRRGETTYWYEAPRFAYCALLEVNPSGFILRYPALWEAEPENESHA
jgi:uncharacterized protein